MHVLDRISSLTSPVTLALDNLLLRGCTLRVSDGGAVLGLVLYACRETRIQLNARRQPSKSGAFDAFLNVQVALLVLLQFALCAGMARPGALRTTRSGTWTGRRSGTTGERRVARCSSFSRFGCATLQLLQTCLRRTDSSTMKTNPQFRSVQAGEIPAASH